MKKDRDGKTVREEFLQPPFFIDTRTAVTHRTRGALSQVLAGLPLVPGQVSALPEEPPALGSF